jgi:hypothetical protein
MVERRITTNLYNNSEEFQKSGDSLLDLTPLMDKGNFDLTISLLNKKKANFESADWKGGVETEDGRYSFEDVKKIITDVNQGDVSPHLLSANQRLAFAEALIFAGAKIPNKERLIARLRERAVREEKITHAPEIEKPQKAKVSKRWTWKLALAAPPVAALALAFASKPWESARSSNEDLISQSNEPRITNAGTINEIPNDNDAEESGLSNLFNQVGSAVESVVQRVPNVEELESSVADYNLWDFDLNDPENPLTISWESDEVAGSNYQERLEFTLSPIENAVGNHLATQCFTNSEIECSIAFDNFIVAEGHSSISRGVELAMERVRGFLEGGIEVTEKVVNGVTEITRMANLSKLLNPEEREVQRLMLESKRATLKQGDHEANAQVAIVRIEEKFVWPRLYNDLSTTVEEALRTDPTLPQRINLERPFGIFFTCGWRLPGDELSSETVKWYSSSMYLIFVGEAATGQ